MAVSWGDFAIPLIAGSLVFGAALACGDSASSGSEVDAGTHPISMVDGGDSSIAPASLCPEGKPVDWPPGPYAIDILTTMPPDVSFDGPDGRVALKDYFEPCASQSRLLVIRTSGAWCGSCIWHAEHTRRLLDDPRFTGRVELLDLLIGDEDNMPATAAAAGRWRARVDMPGKVGIDTKFVFAPVLLSKSPLPAYAFVDTRTMAVLNALANPDPDTFQNNVALELAKLDHQPRPSLAQPKLFDGILTEDQLDQLRGMKLPGMPPPDPTNEYGDVAAAAAFGRELFSDTQLAASGVSCATCHATAHAFSDGIPQSVGVAKVDRNSPSIALAAHSRWQFWDGRADTLWMQALGPPENTKEIASNRLYIAHQIKARYQSTYAAVFGAKYPLPANLDTLPANGKPGDPAFDGLQQGDRDAVTRIYVNIGKAIAAFERSLRVKPNALDRYADGDVTALDAAQKKALGVYFVTGCAQCHWGPAMTDDAFHVIRFPTGRQDGKPDPGRLDILAGLPTSEFVATSKWSDAPSAAKLLVLDAAPSMLGAFKTPPLRGVAQTAPYGHGGTFATLLDVSKHYGTRAKNVGDSQAVGDLEPWVPEFDANVQEQLPDILDVLTADVETP